MNTIREAWLSCRSRVFDDEPDGESLEDLRTAFHCGASVVIGQIKAAIVAGNAAERSILIEAQIQEFVEELREQAERMESP